MAHRHQQLDSDMSNKDCRFAYLGTNNVIGGQELGKAAKGLRPEGGKYATFVGLKTVANAKERIGGFGEGAGANFVSRDSLADQGDQIDCYTFQFKKTCGLPPPRLQREQRSVHSMR